MASAIESCCNQIKSSLEWSHSRIETSAGAARMTADRYQDRLPVMGEIRMIGGALVLILLMVFVLTEIYAAIEFSTDAEGAYDGPFGEVVTSLENIGATALVLLVLALLVVAASAIMRFFGSSGFSR